MSSSTNDDHARRSEFFVGIDSDGCAFDTMEVKHKECFIPNIVRYYRLAAVSKYAREAAEFVNLYSRFRGINRFPALLRTFDLLSDWPEVQRRGIAIPRLEVVRQWTQTETKLGNPALAEAVALQSEPELAQLLEWSKAVNAAIADMVENVPPFTMVRPCLELLRPVAEILVVSATPSEALTREWDEHGLTRYVNGIHGQEQGTKTEALARAGDYPACHSLMIGDAPGDQYAAQANGALFFPILPGAEEESWQRLYDEGIPRFLEQRFAGQYQDGLIAEFERILPDVPPWKR